ncbi:MAG TPA: ABC transporter permease [Candidatus Acidoferrum sp.]|nr:ABC transporter permease [Candidatus Acidoferrum sp.]
MFYNSLKITLRNLLGNKLYSFINIFGLAVGLASVILLGLYVRYELGYDRQWAAADDLYRISRDIWPPDNTRDIHMASAPIPLADLLKQDFPQQIEEVARMRPVRVLLRRDDAAYYEDGVRYVDGTFFKLFDFKWLQGDMAHAFDAPDSIVLTRSKAARYFGSEDALGKTLLLENTRPLKVTGIIADLPPDTHLTGDAFITLESFLRILPDFVRSGWNANMMHTYVKLKPGTDVKALAAQMPAFTESHLGKGSSKWSGLTVMKVSDVHLHSTLDYELQPHGSYVTVLTLGTVAIAILLIACFNFMNLATARSTLRSREVGVRKTVGSDRTQLVLQFLGESIGMTLLATLLAVACVEVALPAFVAFTAKQIAFDPLHDHGVQVSLVLLVLIVGLVSGSWPAFYLASFKPALVLRSSVRTAVGGALLRNLLVVLQFAISITLVVATAVVFLQLRYARAYDGGFNKEQVVVLQATASQGLTKKWQALKEQLLRNPDVLGVTASDNTPGSVNISGLGLTVEGATEMHNMPSVLVDYGFFETYDVKLLAGRLFAPDFAADVVVPAADPKARGSANLILNAAGAREFGLTPEAAVGKAVDTGNGFSGRIVGVVADSNFESVRSSVKPLVFLLLPSGFLGANNPAFASASVRISGRNVADTLAWIDTSWKQVIPEFPISRSFLSDDFAALYRDDTRLGQMFSSFSVLAIVIACLGLYGLATFNTQRRIKEIGVRKVMGGSVWSIVLLLTNDFSKLVLIANVIAWPVAYYAMHRWLQNFAYRIDLTPLVFIGSGLIALCIAWVTVGGTAARAASQKPVLALRYE